MKELLVLILAIIAMAGTNQLHSADDKLNLAQLEQKLNKGPSIYLKTYICWTEREDPREVHKSLLTSSILGRTYYNEHQHIEPDLIIKKINKPKVKENKRLKNVLAAILGNALIPRKMNELDENASFDRIMQAIEKIKIPRQKLMQHFTNHKIDKDDFMIAAAVFEYFTTLLFLKETSYLDLAHSNYKLDIKMQLELRNYINGLDHFYRFANGPSKAEVIKKTAEVLEFYGKTTWIHFNYQLNSKKQKEINECDRSSFIKDETAKEMNKFFAGFFSGAQKENFAEASSKTIES